MQDSVGICYLKKEKKKFGRPCSSFPGRKTESGLGGNRLPKTQGELGAELASGVCLPGDPGGGLPSSKTPAQTQAGGGGVEPHPRIDLRKNMFHGSLLASGGFPQSLVLLGL